MLLPLVIITHNCPQAQSKEVNERINYILDTLLGEYTHAQNKAKHNKHCAHTLWDTLFV